MNTSIRFLIIGLAAVSLSGCLHAKQPGSTIPPQSTSPAAPQESPTTQADVDRLAGFAIFTNGLYRVFSAAKYHNLSPDVYIEAKNPNIIQVKKSGITWNDFFKTLPFKLTKECLTTGTGETFCTSGNQTLKFYLNGVETEDLLDREIQDGDRALITYGSENEAQIQQQLNRVPNPKNLSK
ncbi:hypothetical protein IH980_00600 [Patescibacteria group bacterium]|nr:hypothetical protein [Patescibacteria group bacterium]